MIIYDGRVLSSESLDRRDFPAKTWKYDEDIQIVKAPTQLIDIMPTILE